MAAAALQGLAWPALAPRRGAQVRRRFGRLPLRTGRAGACAGRQGAAHGGGTHTHVCLRITQKPTQNPLKSTHPILQPTAASTLGSCKCKRPEK